jgi:hypothetical protein
MHGISVAVETTCAQPQPLVGVLHARPKER